MGREPSADTEHPVHPIIQNILILTKADGRIVRMGREPSADTEHPVHPIIQNILILTKADGRIVRMGRSRAPTLSILYIL